MMLFSICDSESNDVTAICANDVVNIGSTTFACLLLIVGSIYVVVNSKQRCRTLFYLHNIRSLVQLMLIFTNIFEVAESYLAVHITIDENISISPLQIPYAWMSFAMTMLLIAFVRICEIYDKAGFLYLSMLCQIFVFVTKIFKVELLIDTLDLNDLRPVLIECTIACLMILVLLDAFTIYTESVLSKTLKSTTASDEHIGYKHSNATFWSKITFFWFYPLIWKGFRDPLELDDLGTLNESDTCRTQYDRFNFIYRSFESKTPSLWLCYVKAHWKNFLFGGLLKLLGDLTALVGPISIAHIVEYIQINLSASSLSLISVPSPDTAIPSKYIQPYTFNGTFNKNMSSNGVNDVIEITPFHNYSSPSSDAAMTMTTLTAHRLQSNRPNDMMSALLINENTEIYYPTWMEFIENGWIMALLVLFATLAQGTFSQASTHIVNMIGIRLRTSLQSFIYRKIALISSSCFVHDAHANENGNATTTTTINKNNSNASISIDANETYINRYANNDLIIINGGNDDENASNENDDKTKVNSNSNETIGPAEQFTTIDAGTITNLVSQDTLNVMSFFWIAHYVWAIPLKISFVMYLLYQMLGISAIIGSMVCITLMIPLQFFIGKRMSENAKITATNTDERLRRIGELLVGIKIIKLHAWEKVFAEKIQKSRQNELKCLDMDSIYWTLMTFLTHLSSVVITFVTIAVFLSIENNDVTDTFTTGRIFAALALFNQLTVPLFIFPICIPMIISAIVSTRRIEQFLRQPEIQKQFEGIRNMARVMSRSDASLDVFEIDENEGQTNGETKSIYKENTEIPTINESLLEPSNKFISTVNEHKPGYNYPFNNEFYLQNIDENPKQTNRNAQHDYFYYYNRRSFNASIKLKKNNQISASIKMDRNRPRQKSLSTEIQMEIPNELVISIRNAVFLWNRNSMNAELPLRIDRLDIPRGKLTVIVGRNGTGKTSLIGAILKEMYLISGELIWNKYTTIAYVQQTPWLMKTTIRENILFGEPFRPRRYEKVLVSCALKEDLRCLPDGDLTEIGANGINLSGGQKQRISIARALYSSANVVIMDDPLSSLDNEVSKWIFDNSIKNMLLKHQRTVILVTQKIHLIHNSDYIISMENNSIRAKGTYRVIESKDYELIQEWNSMIAKENAKNETFCTGKTARERWKLFKNISKIGLQHYSTNDENEYTQSIAYNGCKQRKPSIYGSRHLTYDIPFPMDECYNDDIEIRRCPSKRHTNQFLFGRMMRKKTPERTTSLNVRENNAKRMPVTRNISSPTTMQYANNYRESHIESTMRHFDFRQFIGHLSLKRKNNISRKNSRTSKQLNASASINNVTLPGENGRQVKRFMSTISKHSEDAEDDEICSDYNEETTNQLMYDEERKYGKIPTKIYLLYLKVCGLWTVGIFCISALAWQVMKIYLDVWLKDWTDIDSTNRFSDMSYSFGIYGLLSTICVVFSMISTPCGQYAGSKARRILHEQLLQSIVQKSIYFFQIAPFGRLMNRFSLDMAVIDKKIAATSQRLLQFILLCFCSILLNSIITPWFIVLTIPICGAYYLIQKLYRFSSRELQRLDSITSSPILSHFAETIQGVVTIRAYNQEGRFMEMLFKRMEANNIAVIMQNTSNRWLGIALDFLGGFIVFLAIVTALLTAKYFPNSTSPSLVALAINYTLLVPIYLNWVVKLFADMEMYIGAVERISHYIQPNGCCGNIDDNGIDENLNQSNQKYIPVPISWPHRGDIRFENITLRYENQRQNIIENLNLTIPAGQRIGIVGRTASGKSTLAMSLFRVVDIVCGQICIDDVNIAKIHTDEIRTRLSCIPQEVMLFNGTLRENLDPNSHYTDLDLWNSLEMAQLKQTIVTLPAALNTIVTNNGSNVFSAGEKQLFCLARAILRGSCLLVMDEATSNMDTTTECALLEAAAKAFQGRTIITIAHRLTTLLNYDRIIVMENGNIVEDGTPDELRHRIGGKFSSMLYSSVQNGNDFVPDEKL